MSEVTAPSLKQFIIRPWIWHFLVTLTFAILLLLVIRPQYTDRSADRTDFLMNLAILVVCWVHTLLILIFSMRRFARKQLPHGGIYILHFFASASLGFYAYMMLNIGWIYALKH
jgi:apolipoprotein N-acyltransferase